MSGLLLQSPAKVNLFLKVLNKRPDGYHNIVTLFERVDLCDEICLDSNKVGHIRISCNHPNVPTGPKNLVYKVVKMLQKDFGITEGVDIRINKRIPVAAGLAGGSSNAATTLLGLNRLWGLRLGSKKLFSYARQIGSDVPFFLYNYSWALGQEKGDVIKKINIKTKLWHVLIIPRIKMYSWKVYDGLKLKLTKKDDDVNILIHHLRKNNLDEARRAFINDLEASIVQLCPRLVKIREKLKLLNAQNAMFSGSGPCVFGIADSEKDAKTIAAILKKRFSQVFVVRTL